MITTDIKDNTYTDFKKEVNDRNPKFKVGDRVRISKHENIFAKGYTPNWSEKIFVIKKVKKNQSHGHIWVAISMVKKLLEHFMKKNSKKLIKMNLE